MVTEEIAACIKKNQVTPINFNITLYVKNGNHTEKKSQFPFKHYGCQIKQKQKILNILNNINFSIQYVNKKAINDRNETYCT